MQKPERMLKAQGGDTLSPLGWCEEMVEVERRILLYAPSPLSILILGETGTGKELVARRLHELSERRKEAFVAVNCAAVPAELAVAELFGYEKGAFTGAFSAHKGLFAQADGGTLFLDEIGELPLDAQSKILRALQEGQFRPLGATKDVQVDVRIVAATHQKLHRMISAGRFREDLLHRLNGAEIHLPPLRRRGADVIRLAEVFWRWSLEPFGILPETAALGPGVPHRLQAYAWPGNVRELEKAIQRAQVENRGTPVLSEEALLTAHPSIVAALILDLLGTRKPLATVELTRRTRAPERAVKLALQQLEDLGSIRKVRERWLLAEVPPDSSKASAGLERPSSQTEQILAFISSRGRVQRWEVQVLIHRSERETNRVLSELIDLGLLKSDRKGNAVFYFIPRRRRTLL